MAKRQLSLGAPIKDADLEVDSSDVFTTETRSERRDRRLRERSKSSGSLKDESVRHSAETHHVSRQQRRWRREKMDEEVFHAVQRNSHEKMKELVLAGADVNAVYRDYSKISTKSLLHICCEKGRLECVKIIMENGGFLNIRDKWGQTPLMYCMITQYHEIGEILLAQQSDLANDRDHYGKSPLHCAAESGSLESVSVLLRYGADVCGQNVFGVTPLMAALSKGSQCPDMGGMVQMMLDAKYDLELKDYRCKRTVLQMAVIACCIPAVEVLLAAGADVNTRDGGKRTPLTNAVYCFAKKVDGEVCEVNQDGMVIIVMLTQYNSELNITVENSNPLVGCAKVDAADLAEFFLSNGSNPDITFDTSSSTPLIIATSKNSIGVIRVLLRWNCRLDQKSPIRWCDGEHWLDALELSILLGHLEITRLLVLAGSSLQRVSYLKSAIDEEIPFYLRNDPDFHDWLQDMASNPRCLAETCVLCIRHSLGWSVESKVQHLPVPPKIKDMITLKLKLDCTDIAPT